MAKIEEILEIERLDRDLYRGAAIETHLQRTFGGQVAGQSLMAAVSTVEADKHVHSLHGYFLRPGVPDVPTIFQIDRLREGRSFATRRVTAIQEGESIFSMSASFHLEGQEGIEHQDTMPNVIDPDEIPVPDTSELREDHRKFLEEWAQWDIRVVPREKLETDRGYASQQRVWIRCVDSLPDDFNFHVCTLAYMSDMTLLGSSKVPHPGVRTQEASLDHAMWFLRPFRADEWLLYDQISPSADAGRALTQGRLFDRQGRLIAAVVQEGLSRLLRDGAQPFPVKLDDAEKAIDDSQ
ncbi:MAG TPA: acyl-CoA thioesterase II [Actinomycetales bacterium]|nr:acyl-CoA thioesterase II [Actinomycetales bacterium]